MNRSELINLILDLLEEAGVRGWQTANDAAQVEHEDGSINLITVR